MVCTTRLSYSHTAAALLRSSAPEPIAGQDIAEWKLAKFGPPKRPSPDKLTAAKQAARELIAMELADIGSPD